MSSIPEDKVTIRDLEIWYEMQEQLRKLRASEMLMRERLFGHYFPDPKEGTNIHPIGDGYLLKGTYKINRLVDEGAVSQLSPVLWERGYNLDELLHYKMSLRLSEYRKLTAEQQKFFDQVLLIKPGAPSLEIVEDKKAKKKAEG